MYILKSDSLRTFFGIGQGDSLLRISRPLHHMKKPNASNMNKRYMEIIAGHTIDHNTIYRSTYIENMVDAILVNDHMIYTREVR
jgi:hypothetical protein